LALKGVWQPKARATTFYTLKPDPVLEPNS